MFKLQYISLKNSIETSDIDTINKQIALLYKTNKTLLRFINKKKLRYLKGGEGGDGGDGGKGGDEDDEGKGGDEGEGIRSSIIKQYNDLTDEINPSDTETGSSTQIIKRVDDKFAISMEDIKKELEKKDLGKKLEIINQLLPEIKSRYTQIIHNYHDYIKAHVVDENVTKEEHARLVQIRELKELQELLTKIDKNVELDNLNKLNDLFTTLTKELHSTNNSFVSEETEETKDTK